MDLLDDLAAFNGFDLTSLFDEDASNSISCAYGNNGGWEQTVPSPTTVQTASVLTSWLDKCILPSQTAAFAREGFCSTTSAESLISDSMESDKVGSMPPTVLAPFIQGTSNPGMVSNSSAIATTTVASQQDLARPQTSGFVNVYLIVDPASNNVIVPHQALTYTDGQRTSTAMVGPCILDGFPKDVMLTQDLIQQKLLELFPHLDLSTPQSSSLPAASGGSEGMGGCSEHPQASALSSNTFPPEQVLSTMLGGSVPPVAFPASVSPMPSSSEASAVSSGDSKIMAPPGPRTNTSFSASIVPPSMGSLPFIGSLESCTATGHDPCTSGKVSPVTCQAADGTLPPLRALSAYNFFFRDERERILNGGEYEWTKTKQERLLDEHWSRDRTKKRRHRKTHGKINFTSLSKLISQRWKDLPEENKDFYREIAAKDWERYNKELSNSRNNDALFVLDGFHQSVVG